MKKYSLLSTLSLLFVAGILFFSCQKDISTEHSITVTGNTDLATKISASVSGFVTDENDHPVQSAAVSAGSGMATTDEFGYFEIKNVQLVKNAAFVTINKSGYFKGIKTWIAAEGHPAFFRIKLLPKTNAGAVSGSSGGDIILAGGMKISFPAAAFVNASTGAAYTGSVTVSAQWRDPNATDMGRTMPGDLRGMDATGALKMLTDYGMAAVELTGSSNELLQIAPGRKATLTMPIPASMLATAPANIPLWYFNETNGLWKEEGTAEKTGNTYSGDVSHFSFWDFDVPGDYVHFECTLLNPGSIPDQYGIVLIRDLNNPQSVGRYGFTDATGYVGGLIPANTQLKLDVYPAVSCSGILYSQTFSTAVSDISLGNILIPIDPTLAIVSGTVIDCNGVPLANSQILLWQAQGWYWSYPVSAGGTFSFPYYLCSGNQAISVLAQDLNTLTEGVPAPFNLVPGTNPIGNISACGSTNSNEYFNYSINGASYAITTPSGYFGQYSWSADSTSVTASDNINSVMLFFRTSGSGVGSQQPFQNFLPAVAGIPGPGYTPTPGSTVSITEYGNIGQFIAGNFNTTMIYWTQPVTTVPVTGSFRVRRSM